MKISLVDRILVVPVGWLTIGSVITRPYESISTLDWVFFWMIAAIMVSFIIEEIVASK